MRADAGPAPRKRKAAPKPAPARAAAPQAKAYVSQGAAVAAAAYLAGNRKDRAAAVKQAKSKPSAQRTGGEHLLLGIHGVRTSAHTREHNRLVAPGKYYAGSTPRVIPSINKQPTKPFEDFEGYTKRAMKGKLSKDEKAAAVKATSTPIRPAWFKGARAGTLFAMQQLLRPSAALGAAALNRTKDGSSVGSRWRAAKRGFSHPDTHAGDWVKAAKAAHVPVPVVAGTAASIILDPTTYIAPGGGTAAKEAALHAYSEAIASGAARHEAVAAARKVWEEAPAHAKVPGPKLRVAAGVPFSRKLRFAAETKPSTAAGRVKVGAGKLGIKHVTPGGDRLRNAVRSVAPSVRPAGMNPVDFTLARQAGTEGRAGERAAQRHAEHRLHAYHAATKDMPEERQHAIRVAIQDTPHNADEHARHLIFEKHGLSDHEQAVAHEIHTEAARQYKIEPGRAPLTPESRVGHVAAPQTPKYEGSDVAATRAAVDKARRAVLAAERGHGEAKARRMTLGTMRFGKQKVKSLGEEAAARAREAAHEQLKLATKAHTYELGKSARDRKLYRQHIRNVQAYEAAPKSYVHNAIRPDLLETGAAARQATGRGAKAGAASYMHTSGTKLADMSPERLANYDPRLAVTQAQRALEHGRTMNAANVNDWIRALGREIPHADAAQMVGQKARLFAVGPRGLTPLFDKYGKVDAAAVNAAKGSPITHVEAGVDDLVRQLARGNKAPAFGDAADIIGKEDASRAGSIFDDLTRKMKFAQTQVNPSYWIRNAIGDSFNALIAGTTGADFARSARLLRTHGSARKLERVLSTTPEGRKAYEAFAKADGRVRKYKGVPGGQASDAQVVALAAKHGAIDTGINRGELQAVREGTDIGNLTKGQQALSRLGRANDARENIVRLATFHGALERGMTPEAAAAWSLKHHFDYSDLSHGEQIFARRIFPFWTFMARNTPLQVKSLVSRPMVAGNVEKLRRGTLQAAGIPPSATSGMEPFEQTNTPWGTPAKIGGFPVTAAPGLPTMDLSNIPLGFSGEQLKQAAGNVIGRSHPVFGTGVLGLGAGLNPLNLRDVPKWTPAPSWWPDGLKGPLQTKLVRDKRSGQVVRSISGKTALAMNILPPVSVASKVGQPHGPNEPSKAYLRGAGWALGPRIAVENPHQRRINQLYDRIDQIDTELARIEPQALKHKPGDKWKGHVRKLLDEQAAKQAEIYTESKAMGTKYPLGQKRGKGRRKQHAPLSGGIGGGIGGGKLGGR